MDSVIKVSMFKNKQSRYATGVVNLWDWLLMENQYVFLVEEIRKESNPERRRELKSFLPAITVSCICSERQTDKILEYTNLICIDIDGKDNPSISDMEELKRQLSKLPYIIYCGLSASGTGLFCIIPYADSSNHKLCFDALKNDFEKMGINIDKGCGDACRLRYYSCDKYPHVNRNAEIYTFKVQTTSVEYVHRLEHKPKRKYRIKPPKPDTILTPNIIETYLRPSNLIMASATPLTKKEKVERLLNEVIRNQVDITYHNNDWIAIGNIIKNMFGEEGRALFHKVSSFYPNYDCDETDSKYSAMIVGRYRYNSDRLFEIAAEYKLIPPLKSNS